MNESTAKAIDVLYRSSAELGELLDELVRLHTLMHQALSSLHDMAVEEHAVAIVLPHRYAEWRSKSEYDEMRGDDLMGRDPA